MKSNYKVTDIFFIILGLVLINRFIYILIPMVHLGLTIKIKNINFDTTLSFSFLLIALLKMTYDFLKYTKYINVQSISLNISEYSYEPVKHSFLFWSVICFPLLLCPLPQSPVAFIIVSLLIFLIAILIAKHSNELILNPLFFFSGKTVYELNGEKNNNHYYIILNNRIEKNTKFIEKQYIKLNNTLLLEKKEK